MCFIANFLLNPTVKNFEYRQTFGKVINGKYRWSFLTHSKTVSKTESIHILSQTSRKPVCFDGFWRVNGRSYRYTCIPVSTTISHALYNSECSCPNLTMQWLLITQFTNIHTNYGVVSRAIKWNKRGNKVNVLFYFIAEFILLQLWFYVQWNKINAATILQGYCSTHLFYFIAHETTALKRQFHNQEK